MMTPIKKEKAAIRKDCSDKRNAIDKEIHKSMDEKICQTATSLVSFRYADIILLYAPIKSEIDVMPIFHEALRLAVHIFRLVSLYPYFVRKRI